MTNLDVTISFEGCSMADANRYASSLMDDISAAADDVAIRKARPDSNTQDLGSTLILVLGTASVNAIAAGISSWIARHSGARLKISAKGIEGTHIDSADAAKIAEAFYGGRNSAAKA